MHSRKKAYARRSAFGRVGALVLVVGGLAGAPSVSAGADERRTVLDGVYTSAQAARGEQKFGEVCAACHAPTQFAGPVFQQIWKNRPVGELYATMSTTMPESNPGSLSPQEYADIVGYVLQQNGYPAGAAEAPPDQAALDKVTFQPLAK